MTQSILINGGAGFIGLHTAIAVYEAGYKPILVDNFSNAEKHMIARYEQIIGESAVVYEGDCRDLNFMQTVFAKEKELIGAIHFAALKAVGESSQKPLEYYHNNLVSLMTLIQVMEKMGVSNLVFSSSATVYGDPDVVPLTEESPRKQAMSPYGNTKIMCEDILRDCVAAGMSIKTMALRYFNPIGAHSSGLIGELPLGVPNNLIPFVTQAAAGLRGALTVFGDDYNTADGTCIRDYIHVVDLAQAHIKALTILNDKKETHFYDTINIGTGNGSSVLEVLKKFEEINGVKVPYGMGARRPGDVEITYANVDKAREVLGWQTELTLEDALRDAWAWQKNIGEGA